MPSRLRALDLLGYKTFAAKTRFVFGDDITAIVGPNGSGKSNIADAVRWVLGEQSFSLLRGKKTEDMIFAGSEQRPRANVAQVSVTFDNGDSWLPIDFAEVSIARRAYRDGQNDYYLNGQRVRLRDITELLGKVGLAQRTYTMVGQGLVDNALSLRADERRLLFEEAAGISLYRAKREDALRKLDQTQRNLERVHDILAEIRPRLRTLERQAGRADEYHQIKNELDGLLRTWYGYHWHQAQRDLSAARAEAEAQAEALRRFEEQQLDRDRTVAESRAAIASLRARLNAQQGDAARLRADSEEIRRRLAVADERLRSLAEQRQALSAELGPLQADLEAQTERVDDAQSELARLAAERDAARAQVEAFEADRARRETEHQSAADRAAAARDRAAALAAQISERQGQRARLAAERERLAASAAEHGQALHRSEALVADRRARLERLEQQAMAAVARRDAEDASLRHYGDRIAQSESSLAAITGQLADAAAEAERLSARSEVLEQLSGGDGGEGAGLAVLREAARRNRISIQAELADILAVPPELDAAISAALGPFLAAVLLDHEEEALDLLAGSEGRAALLSLGQIRPASLDLPPQSLDHPQMVGLASNLVTCQDSVYRPAVEALLGRAVIVRSRAFARQLAARLPPGAAAVTLAGEVFFASGAILAGRSASAPSGAWALAREQRELPARIEGAESRRQALHRQRDEAEAVLKQLRAEMAAAAGAQRDLQAAEREAAAARDAAQLELERAEAEADQRRRQMRILEEEVAATYRDEAALTNDLKSLEIAAAEAHDAARSLAAQAMDSAADDLAAQAADWRTAAAVAAQAAADGETRLAELRSSARRTSDLIAARRSRIDSLTAEADSFGVGLAADRANLERMEAQLSSLHAQIVPAGEELARLEADLTGVENAEAEGRARLHASERRHHEAQLEAARKADELESLRRRISDDFGLVSLDYLEGISGPAPLPLDGLVEHLPLVERLPEGIEESLRRRRNQLRRIGLINPEAASEYDEVKQRHEFLTTQVHDLQAAEAQLREVIAELDQLMEREFRRTFEATAEQFKETFGRLFGGGSARLILTEPDDLANAGIDILARLPGRKLQGLSVLSGGERALTACALIFALLRVNPPPFAVLDEVDAALDEANVGRFRDVLVELSLNTQIVLITHNRGTIEAANTVYGISMGPDSTSQAISLKLDGQTVARS